MILIVKWIVGPLLLAAAGLALWAMMNIRQAQKRARRDSSPRSFPHTPPSDETVFLYRPEFMDRARRMLYGTPYQRAVAYVEVAYPGMQISHADSLALGDAGLFLERELNRKGLTLVSDGGENLRIERKPPEA